MPHFTLGEHFCPIPSPNGAAPHVRGTLLPRSVAQQHRDARSWNTSGPFRRPMVPRRTLGEHFRPVPSPDCAEPHARGTFSPVSVAQQHHDAHLGDTYAHFRRPMSPNRTLGEHFRPVPSPNSTTTHARGTLLPRSVARQCRAARPGNISAPFRRPMVHLSTSGEHFHPFP